MATEGSGCSRRIVEPFVKDYSVRRIDVGALLGIGAEARSRSGTIIGVEGRFEVGLLDMRPRVGGTSRNMTSFLVVNVAPARR